MNLIRDINLLGVTSPSKVSKIPRWCKNQSLYSQEDMNLNRSIDLLGVMNPSQVSKIPRWCKNQSLYSLKNTNETSTVFSKCEIIGICEPPALQKEALYAVWKVKSQRKEVDQRRKETIAHVEFLKIRLKEVKAAIESISLQLENPHTTPEEFAGEFDNQDTKQNVNYQQDLLDNIDLEDKLTLDLEKAHHELWEAGVAEQFFSLEVEEKLTPVIHTYERRKAFMAQKRVARENDMKNNAMKIRAQTLKTVAKAIEQTVQDDTKKTQVAVKVLDAKNARDKMEKFIKKTMFDLRQQKLLEACDKKLKQDRQHKLLWHLKKELDDQKDLLARTSLAKQKRAEKIAEEKDKIHNDLLKSGKNPYFIESLLAIEEKRAIQQRKLLDKEAERLTQLQRDYEVAEKSVRQEELRKKKWDNFWAKKLEKKKKALQQKESMFLDLDEETTVETTVDSSVAEIDTVATDSKFNVNSKILHAQSLSEIPLIKPKSVAKNTVVELEQSVTLINEKLIEDLEKSGKSSLDEGGSKESPRKQSLTGSDNTRVGSLSNNSIISGSSGKSGKSRKGGKKTKLTL